ncbi:MAG TPA: VTT domain-containing protein [Candidatus Acidoferrales bacterium]|jgi:membrane protein YqaA with SNARE-associated domain|nr:VTT domain-containing protein [Candidatus Acidoferrales bacterium]
MNQLHIPHWLQVVLATSGGLGLFVVGVVDSAFLPLPVISDALTISLCADNPLRMPYYALMSTLGSVIGCMALYYFVRRGEEAFLRKYEGARAARVRHWLKRNGFITTLVAALMPPPTPFKFVVIGAGVLEMPVKSFFLAILIARSIRFFGEGFLAARYGPQAYTFFSSHKLSMGLISVGVIAMLYIVVRLLSRVPKSME